MFNALVQLGRQLDAEGQLPHVGFKQYADANPIKWIVHFDQDRLWFEQSATFNPPRPFSGRTGQTDVAHLLVDEAAYALGVDQMATGELDGRADAKHQSFRSLLHRFADSQVANVPFRDALLLLLRHLESRTFATTERADQITSKEWVDFSPTTGPLADTSLFEHHAAKAFWREEMERECLTDPLVVGECAVCGQRAKFLRKLPLGVEMSGKILRLHSLNASAYTSFIDGAAPDKKAHLSICFDCGDFAARAFNYLNDSSRHSRKIFEERKSADRDKLSNQFAIYWLRAPAPILVGDTLIDLTDLDKIDFGAPIGADEGSHEADLGQLATLLNVPWRAMDAAFQLDDYAFYLALLSPNVTRLAVRDWFVTSLSDLKASLTAFVARTRMVSDWGDPPRPVSIRVMVGATAPGDPNLTRKLLRTAYTGVPPSKVLAIDAGRRLNDLLANEQSKRDRQATIGRDRRPVWNDAWPQALAAVIRLGMFFGSNEEDQMQSVNPVFESTAYHCGRLLAALEEAQQRSHYNKSQERLDTTIVNRWYGGVLTMPAARFGQLYRLVAVAHLPDAGPRINQEVEAISSRIVQLGGFPPTLTPAQQAEFGLGFYHERAEFRTWRSARPGASADGAPVEDADDGEVADE